MHCLSDISDSDNERHHSCKVLGIGNVSRVRESAKNVKCTERDSNKQDERASTRVTHPVLHFESAQFSSRLTN